MPRIMVVDDDADSRESIGKTLQSAGCAVVCADNGWDALMGLEQAAPDAIIVDVVMPGMDGSTFVRIVGNDIRRQHLPIIVISGFDRADVFRKLGSNSQRPFLEKGDPAFYDKLLELVRQLAPEEKKES